MQVSEALSGVKVYNLSAGKSLSEWIESATKNHVNLRKSVRLAGAVGRICVALALFLRLRS